MLVLTQSRTTGEDLEYIKRVLVMNKQSVVLKKIKKPSGNTQDIASPNAKRIVNLKVNEDGSVNTFLNGEKYPVRAFPDSDTVFLTAYYKRFIPLIVKSLSNMGWIKRIITVLAIRYNFNIIPEWFKYVFSTKGYLLKDENYCPAVKEVRRVLRGRLDDNLIDAIGLVLEYDSAYKYVLQDIITEFEKHKFYMNPLVYLEMMFEIIVSRSESDDIKKFSNVWKFIGLYLWFDRKALKTIVEIVRDLRIDRIYPSHEDYYWMLFLKVYNCFGMSEAERTKKYLELKNTN